MSEVERAVERYIRLGLAPVPLGPKTKRPLPKAWQHYVADLADFGGRRNVGLILGPRSHDLVHVDLDCEEARLLADHFLPATGRESGRPSSPRCGRWYFAAGVHLRQYEDVAANGGSPAMLLELRGQGGQTMVPPSTHPCGEQVIWEQDGHALRIEQAPLERAATHLGACCLIARHWPTGKRHHASLALSGVLIRAGWTEPAATDFIAQVTRAAGDPEERGPNVASTSQRLGRDLPATGLPRLAELLGDPVVQRLRQWLHLDLGGITVRQAAQDRPRAPKPEPAEPEPATSEILLPEAAWRGSWLGLRELAAPVTAAQPAHLFGAWWAAIATATSNRRYGTWSGSFTACEYIALVGKTGDYKSSASTIALAQLRDSYAAVLHGSTSDAGLLDWMIEVGEKHKLLYQDELDGLLRACRYSGSTLESLLRSLYQPLMGRPLTIARTKAKGGQGIRTIEHPHLTLLGATHPSTLWTSLDAPAAIAAGTLNRFAFFLAKAGASLPITSRPDLTLAGSLTEHLHHLSELAMLEVGLEAAARERWIDWHQTWHAELLGREAAPAAMTERTPTHVARLALAYATDELQDTVSDADMAAAIAVGGYLEACALELLRSQPLAPSPRAARAAALEDRVRHLLRDGQWRSVREITLALRSTERVSADELRAILRAADGVESGDRGGAVIYRLAD